MPDKELMNEFEQEFEKIKKELGFKPTLEEMDRIFFLKDFISKEGYVSNKLSRQLCGRMVDLFGAWYNYLHTIVMPNPASMLNMTESQAFSDDEKQEMLVLMAKCMAQVSKNTMNGLTKDKKDEAEFIDSSAGFWKKELNPKLREIIKKVKANWIEKSQSKTNVEVGRE
jgi:hypothetical protein